MAKKIRADSPEEFVKLEREVKKYIEKNPYPGYNGLVLESLVLMPDDGTTRLAKVHFTDSNLKIDRMEKTWLDNLKHLGDPYGVRVVLHEKYYLI